MISVEPCHVLDLQHSLLETSEEFSIKLVSNIKVQHLRAGRLKSSKNLRYYARQKWDVQQTVQLWRKCRTESSSFDKYYFGFHQLWRIDTNKKYCARSINNRSVTLKAVFVVATLHVKLTFRLQSGYYNPYIHNPRQSPHFLLLHSFWLWHLVKSVNI